MFALLTLTIERFLALTYPFFHPTAVTKRRLVLFQVFLMITTVSLPPLTYFYAENSEYDLEKLELYGKVNGKWSLTPKNVRPCVFH